MEVGENYFSVNIFLYKAPSWFEEEKSEMGNEMGNSRTFGKMVEL